MHTWANRYIYARCKGWAPKERRTATGSAIKVHNMHQEGYRRFGTAVLINLELLTC